MTEVPTAETAVENVIYMLKVESTIGADKYKEYMLIDGEVACVGDTSVDLTDYAKKSEIPTELPANGGNADTVGGHTVGVNVPSNAKFTDTTYSKLSEFTDDVGYVKDIDARLSDARPANGGTADKVSHALTISYEKDGAVSYQSFDGSADTELNISVITDIASPSQKGLMSAKDKFKLDGIQAGATRSKEPLTINLRQKESTLSMEYTGEFEKSITIHDWETGTTAGTVCAGNDARLSDARIVDLIYPVGSIYMSVNNVNPSTFLGGTWEVWGSGQVPVGVNPNDSDFSTAEKTGGSKSVTPSGTVGGHTLTTNEMPSHGHSISIPASGACTTDSQGNHQHKTNATFVDNAVRLSSEHNTVMGWVSG